MKNIQLIGLIFIMLSCNASEKQVPKSVNYDLKGNVKFLSEKYFATVYNEILDTTITYISIANRSFDKNGHINTIKYFNEDSILMLWIKFHGDGSSIQFDKDGNKQNTSKILSVQDDILYTETYNPSTKELLQKSWTKYDNEQIVWQKSIRLADSLYMEDIYYRNNDGLDTLIKKKFGYEISENYHLMNIKYRSFDVKGNWTERLEYSSNDANDYIVKRRRIEYYE